MDAYRLTDPRHGLLGPIGRDTLVDLARAGVLGERVRVSTNNSPFMPLGKVPEVDAVRRTPAPLGDCPRAVRRRDGVGATARESFFRVLVELKVGGVTGALGASHGEQQKLAYFERGQPVFVHSNLASELLGRFLVERGDLDEARLATAVGAMSEDKNHLHRTLVRLRMLGPAEVFIALREQQLSRLADLCRWRADTFSFVDGARYSGDKLDLHLDAGEAVVRAARELAATRILARMDRKMLLRASVPYSFRPASVGLRLSAVGEAVLAWLDGKHTPAEIVRQVSSEHAARREALMVVYLLHELGVLRLDERAR